jgi:LPXTG-site transpeptidase (sortase) family protein
MSRFTDSRFLRPLLNVVIVAGLVLAAWPLGQTVYGNWSQRSLQNEFEQQKAVQPKPKTNATTAPKVTVKAENSSKKAKTKPKVEKWPLTKLSIPSIELETYVVQGWDDAALRRGPGHYPLSNLPGKGNCVIAGHRNVYGSPFYRLDELLPGAEITLESRLGTYTYTVLQTFPTPDTNTLVLSPELGREKPLLTLITCTLPHTSNRVVLQAVLAE